VTTPAEIEVYRIQRAGIEKHAYFLLAAAGAAIAFAVTQTKSDALGWDHAPLGVAVLCWGASFLAGCRHAAVMSAMATANANLLQIERGVDRMIGNHPQGMEIASKAMRDALDRHANAAMFWARCQFILLGAGAGFYIAWHVLEMYLRRR